MTGGCAGPEGAGKALLIAGPTASGKSALAMALAERLGGTIVNADSMQVYADIPILGAQPAAADQGRVPHRLFGHIDGAETFSLGRWLGDVRAALAEVRAAGRLPILAGGTGLYFKALTQGLSAIPAVPEALRADLRREAEGVTPQALHARLAALDPATAARLRPTDPQRILRALEVFLATGQPLSAFHAAREAAVLPLGPGRAAFFVQPDRAVLRARIETRFIAMMAAGALDEAGRLAARGLDASLPVMRALGVRPLIAHRGGLLSREEAVAEATRDSWAYARRQMTFGRHQLAGFAPTAPDALIPAAEAALAGA